MKLFTGADQPVTHIRAELRDVRLIFMQTKLCLHPIGTPLVWTSGRSATGGQKHGVPGCVYAADSRLPESLTGAVWYDGAGHVAVAGGVTVTDIQILVCAAVVSIHKAGRM